MEQTPLPSRRPFSLTRRLVIALGRTSPATATAILTAVAVIAAQAGHLLVGWLLNQPPSTDTLIAAAIVTVLVSVPIIYDSQMLIRNQRESHAKQKRLTQELAIALDRAEAASQSKAAQMAAMSHELRTPMNAIVGFSDILRYERFGPMQNPKYLDYATDINDSAQHLLGILNGLLDLAKIEAGGFDLLDATDVDLADAAEMALRVAQPLAERQGVAIALQEEAADLTVHASERMLRQIAINLVSNAVKFTPAGGKVQIGVSRAADKRVRLVIADTGIGMSPDEIRVAFTPFGQVNGMLSRRHAGTGLGLPLAKAMTELNGGVLKLASSPGRGTTVTLEFPGAAA